MNQEIEIEFKNILKKGEFEKLRTALNMTANHFKRQINYYFDTEDFSIKGNHSALRIRFKNGQYQLTLKQPHPEGLLETHQHLSESEASLMIKTAKLPAGDVQTLLRRADIPYEDLVFLGQLTTDRAEIPFMSGELVLDHSFYLDHEDYELEFEASDRTDGQEAFDQLLTAHNIPARKTQNKIIRFFNRYKEQINGG
ncbi:adenylate cyclase [Scopulibacillus darangshiensis]|uniref:Adenylate cyclase n=1 Tax=Scopulibacillus darangshiensis TaxID=442528 RepID=A0A4R2NLC0_9BACL|nr:CYTH domain-containing protein [Scopulibacillus darangshiensis]TCP22321.1 adenylate cyclase [Scopulibacillus darangshiensis]